MRRLHLKLYLAVVGTLVAFLLAIALVLHYFSPPRGGVWGVEGAAGVAAVLLADPSVSASAQDEQSILDALARQLRADVALFGRQGTVPLRTSGHEFPATSVRQRPEGWELTVGGPVYHLALADGRFLLVHPRHRFVAHGLHLFMVLALIAVILALLTYPITRGITARLERLGTGVRELGEGNLATRVPVEGRDEVAALARGFNESAERVEQLVRAHKMLLANCSHELRTPLARVRLAIEKQAQDPAARTEIARSIAELDALIGEMLLASRLDAMQRPEHLESLDLLALVAEEAAYFGREATGVTMQVVGDPTLLRRMVRNLLDNAERHAGGARRIEVGPTEDGRARLIVEDAGPGVAPEDRQRVFDAFYRPASSASASGAGLGLSIVRQVARAHGGEVHCRPALPPLPGTLFEVLLPGAVGPR
jgi:signal transduction histidine kinase